MVSYPGQYNSSFYSNNGSAWWHNPSTDEPSYISEGPIFQYKTTYVTHYVDIPTDTVYSMTFNKNIGYPRPKWIKTYLYIDDLTTPYYTFPWEEWTDSETITDVFLTAGYHELQFKIYTSFMGYTYTQPYAKDLGLTSYSSPQPTTYNISGNVYDDLLLPINLADIIVNGIFNYSTQSDSNGTYSLTVEPDTYSMIASKTNYLVDTAIVDVTNNDIIQDFTLSKPTISGNVYNNSGIPVENAIIKINNTELFTDENGYYEIITEPGIYELKVTKECYSEDIATIIVTDSSIFQDFIIDCIECEECPPCEECEECLPDKLDLWLLFVGAGVTYILTKKDNK